MPIIKSKSFSRLKILIGPSLLIILWCFFSFFDIINPIFLPDISETISSFFSFFMEKGIIHLLWTLYRTLTGFLIASLIGIPLGLIVGMNKVIYNSVEVLVDFFRSLPASALFPLFLLVFGVGNGSKIAISVFTIFWTIFVSSIHGVWNIPQTRIRTARVYGASKFQLLKEVVIFDSLPQISAGLRIGLSLSLIIVIVSETFTGGQYGIGNVLYESYLSYDSPRIYALIIIAGFSGFFLNKSFLFLEKKFIHWSGR